MANESISVHHVLGFCNLSELKLPWFHTVSKNMHRTWACHPKCFYSFYKLVWQAKGFRSFIFLMTSEFNISIFSLLLTFLKPWQLKVSWKLLICLSLLLQICDHKCFVVLMKLASYVCLKKIFNALFQS